MAIDIKLVETHSVLILEVSGQVNSITAITLGEQLQRAAQQGHYNIVLDFGSVEYLSSAGLREIMSGVERAKNGGGDLRIANPSKRVSELLELTGLDGVLAIYPTRDEAARSFSS
jgi:anti-anti-sigma factor